MTSRRQLIQSAISAAFLTRAASGTASQPATKPSFAVPAQACDCHTHIYGDPAQFPLSPGRSYTPEIATPKEMSALHRALAIERVVIVTPSVYGTDNSATLAGLKTRGGTARGIAVIDDKTTEDELNRLHRAGFRGIRLNLSNAGQNDPAQGRARLEAAIARVAHRGWHIQMFTNLAVIAGIAELVQRSKVPIVFDHFGGAQLPQGTGQPGFDVLLSLVRGGQAYVKISLAGANTTLTREAKPLAEALIAANPERILWGTDWPHPDSAPRPGRRPTDVVPFNAVDDGAILNQLPLWTPDPRVRRQILADNPARLYAF
ncbi:MAG: amidohydrolase family protein [Acidobacteria bacterium]|nr:amidohydrolase family protein [Acidobacteriota bacterium]